MLSPDYLAARIIAATPTTDFWGWLSASVPAGAVINGGGLLGLAALFASDRILTKGQHVRRTDELKAHQAEILAALKESHKDAIAELVKHHDDLMTVQVARYADLQERHDRLRIARDDEAARASKATQQLAEVATEAGKLASTLAATIDETAKGKR